MNKQIYEINNLAYNITKRDIINKQMVTQSEIDKTYRLATLLYKHKNMLISKEENEELGQFIDAWYGSPDHDYETQCVARRMEDKIPFAISVPCWIRHDLKNGLYPQERREGIEMEFTCSFLEKYQTLIEENYFQSLFLSFHEI